MLKSNFLSKNKKNNQTFSRKEYKFLKPFYEALFEYTFRSWLFHLNYIHISLIH